MSGFSWKKHLFEKKKWKYVEWLSFYADEGWMNASTELINLHAKKLKEAHFGLMFVKCWQNYIKSRLKNSFWKEPSLET